MGPSPASAEAGAAAGPARAGPTRVIALIGIDGSGKTTQAQRLTGWLDARGVPASYHMNPSGRTLMADVAKRLGRDTAADLLGRETSAFIETAVRWANVLRAQAQQAVQHGGVAVMDRYSFCQYAAARLDGGGWRERVVRGLFGVFPDPDLTVFLEVPPQVAFTRLRRRGTGEDTLDYLEGLDAAYRSLPEADGFVFVDATGPADAVERAVRAQVLDAFPELRSPADTLPPH